MRATGVFFTLPAAFAFRGLMPRRGTFSGRLPGSDALRLCAGRPNSATSREHRLPAGESPGASRVSDITTDWDKPVQTLRRSLRTAIPRGRENASGPSLPDAKRSPGGKTLPPARPGPSLVDHDLFLFGALPPVSSYPSSACKNTPALARKRNAHPPKQSRRACRRHSPASALHISFSFLSHAPCPLASTQKTTLRLRTASAHFVLRSNFLHKIITKLS